MSHERPTDSGTQLREQTSAGRTPARLTSRAVAPMLLAVSVGCVSTRTVPPAAAVAVPAAWQHVDQDAGVRATGAQEDLSGWWMRLDDATLSGLIDTAMKGSPTLRSAGAKLREARASRGLAGKDYLPTVTATVSASRSRSSQGGEVAGGQGGLNIPGTQNLYSAGFDASWEPDIFGATSSAVRAAQADLETSEADLQSAQVSLAAEVARNYVELRSYQGHLKIARDNLRSQDEILELVTWRAQAGLVSELDVQQARTTVEQTRATIPAIEANVAASEHRLAVLTGQPPTALSQLLAAPAEIPKVPDHLAVGIPADTLRQRPDVRSTERKLVAATARGDQARAALYPTLSLSGSLGLESLTFHGLTGSDAVNHSVLGSLAAPIFDRSRLKLQIEVKSAEQEQALSSYESTILSALEDVENALVSLGNARRRCAALSDAAQAAQAAAALARSRYTAGLVAYSTVLDTERTLLSVEDDLTTCVADGTLAAVQLYKALGGGWEATPSAKAPQPRRDPR